MTERVASAKISTSVCKFYALWIVRSSMVPPLYPGVWVGRAVVSGADPFRHFALRNATSPEGGGLGKEGRSRPHSSTARRSQPISEKLYALAKASPFRERWHGEAVTERVAPLSLSGEVARRSRDGEGRSPLKLPHRGRISRTVRVSPSTENRTSKAPNSMP